MKTEQEIKDRIAEYLADFVSDRGYADEIRSAIQELNWVLDES